MILKLKLLLLSVVVVSIALACDDTNNGDFVLDTTSGEYVGSCHNVKYKTTSEVVSKPIYTWLSIPYAEPPIGDLRFKSPQPVTRRSGQNQATQWPNSCLQLIDRNDYLPPRELGYTPFPGFKMWRTDPKYSNMSEDCLYLNIFAPKDAFDKPNGFEPYPIMVYFHGGSTVFGSSAMDVYNPEVLVAAKDVIVITINYRLGVFGFLYLENNFPGNQALMDQNLALKWIFENAAHFGGNKNKITIFGQSAGAMLTGYHLFYKDSWPYFNNIILQSGTPLFQPLTPITHQQADTLTRNFLKSSGCNENNLIQCAQTSTQLPLKSLDFYFKLSNFNYYTSMYIMTGFVPVLDGHVLTETPFDALNHNRFKKCDIIIGVTKDEGTLFTAVTGLVTNFAEFPHISHSVFENFVKDYFHFYPNHPILASSRLKQLMLSKYDGGHATDKSYFDEMSKMLTDQMFMCPAYHMADLLYARRIKIYFYVLDEYVESSPWPKWYGTTHSDDIAFVFGHTLTDRTNGFISLNPWAEYKSYSNEVINFTHKILSYWSNFAKKSDPNQNGLPHWEVYDLTYNMTMHPKRSSHNLQKKWLLLKKDDIKMTNENYGEHCSFWNDRSRYLRDVRPRYLQTTKRYSLVQY